MTILQKALSDVVKKSKKPVFLQHHTFPKAFGSHPMSVMLYKSLELKYFYNMILFYVVKILQNQQKYNIHGFSATV